jgi:hypothetical protein
MPRYFFNLNDGEKIIPDVEGTELPDDESARAHAAQVARELARNRERETISWRLAVCYADGTLCFELLFASMGDSISRLSPTLSFLIDDDGSPGSLHEATRTYLSYPPAHTGEGREEGDLGAA